MKNNSIILFILLTLLLSGCSKSDISNNEVDLESSDSGKSSEIEKENSVLKIDYNEIKPNELGKIMVLMYHNIGEDESTWVRTR